jgi:catechol-2,3-dioxygenase
MQPTAVHHVAIKVVDLPRAEFFYCDLLGLPVLRRWSTPDGSDRSLWLDLGGGAFLALERADAGSEPKAEVAAGMHLLALKIDRADRATWLGKLAAANCPIYQQTDYTLYVRDPEGNRVGLSHWPDGG